MPAEATKLRLVHTSPRDLPEPNPETVRPFRLWDSVEKEYVAHRWYATERRALDSALLLVRWEQVGRSIEVLDIRNMKWLATYTRRVNLIQYDHLDTDKAILSRSTPQQ